MSKLTAEEVKKIEQNKLQALEKRKRALNGFMKPQTEQIKSKAASSYVGLEISHVQTSIPSFNKIQAKERPAAVFKLISNQKFSVECPFHAPSIEIMKTVPGRSFDKEKKIWSFPIQEHDNLLAKLKSVASVSFLPRNILHTFKSPPVDLKVVDLKKIDPNLLQILLPFQEEGVRFGVSRNGRCLLGDDMGLGKTLQGLGIAHFFFESWPLLIVCPSSMRFPWEEAILRFLPSVNPFSVFVMTTANDDCLEANVVITSYDLLKACLQCLKQKNFGVVIFDESHFLKNPKSARSIAALELAKKAKHAILLSGTPALSRPQELFPQIAAIDPTCFSNFHEFGVRYCNAKKNKFGWDYSGSSNCSELELLLKRRLMLRRLKSEVLQQLPSKVRKAVILHPTMVKAVSKKMEALESKMETQAGKERRATLLEYYNTSGMAKLGAVREYIEDKLETTGKMLVFAHHTQVMDGLEEMLERKKVGHIRIDGSTSAAARAELCEQFQTDLHTHVALLSIRAANSGITLTAAKLVIFAELYWNPGDLTQAEDRAHRIGQEDSVIIEYLIAKGTADTKLWAMVEKKLKVLKSVGLTKDSFKEADTKQVPDKFQSTLIKMFTNGQGSFVPESRKESVSTLNPDADPLEVKESSFTSKNVATTLEQLFPPQMDILFEQDFNLLEDAFTEDYVFDNLDLEAIEDKYRSECKKPKLEQ